MKENIWSAVTNLGNQMWKRPITQNVPQMKTLDKSDDFPNKLGYSWIQNYAKGFFISSKQVKVLVDPKSFYNLILDKIQNANRRIVLASLYLGTGILERNLVAALNQRLSENSNLIVKVLLDSIRGSRGEVNSRKILLPLLENHANSCQISLYHTPALREPFKSIIPERYKEIIGLQHIKVYLFDNDLIISGANLSQDYFTNRQDRYIVINECQELADFVDGFVQKISEFSFQLSSKNELHLHSSWKYHPFKSEKELFIKEARSRIKNYYEDFVISKSEGCDTVIFPLLEMSPFNLNLDSVVTTKIIETCSSDVNAYLSTGYFNFPELYMESILKKSKANFDLLMAHPTTNGFFSAKGPAKGIPFAYTELADQFLNKIHSSNQEHRVRMHEYVRPGWTFHAKGLWLSMRGKELPFLTMIGSPNFGERSVKRDLECQFLLITDNEDLQREFGREKELLFSSCLRFAESTPKQTDRVPPLWVKAVVLLFRTFL